LNVSGVRVVVGIAGIHPLDVVRHHLGKRIHVASTETSYALWTRLVFSSADTGTPFQW